MTARYHIIIDSPLGERPGELTLSESPEGVSGTMTLLGWDNPVAGAREGDLLRLEHRLHTLVSDLRCVTTLRPAPGGLAGTVQAGRVCMALRGEAFAEKEGAGGNGAD